MLLMIFCAVVSYIFGALPFGLWVGLWWKGIDIRTLGSKNIGATNVLRVLGTGPGFTVFVLDTLKGSVGLLLVSILVHETLPIPLIAYKIVVGLLAIVGHTFSVFLRFKGGKGVATTLGVLLALNPPMALLTLALWVLLVAVTRYVSLASIVVAISLPFTAYFLPDRWYTAFFSGQPGDRWWLMGLMILLALLVTVKHRANIQRLLRGTEAKIGQRVAVDTHGQNSEES